MRTISCLYRPANLPPCGLSCAAAARARAERAWGWRCRWWARVLGVATLGGGARAFDWFSSSSSQPPPRTVFSPSKQHALPAPRSLRRRCDAHLARARSALCAGPAATGLRGARSAGAPPSFPFLSSLVEHLVTWSAVGIPRAGELKSAPSGRMLVSVKMQKETCGFPQCSTMRRTSARQICGGRAAPSRRAR